MEFTGIGQKTRPWEKIHKKGIECALWDEMLSNALDGMRCARWDGMRLVGLVVLAVMRCARWDRCARCDEMFSVG